jgi:hypothetical protein
MRTLMCKDFLYFLFNMGQKGLRGFKQPKMGGPQQQSPNEKSQYPNKTKLAMDSFDPKMI